MTETRVANLLGVPGYMVGLPQSSDSLVYNTAALTLDFHWRVTLRNLVRQVVGALSAWALPTGTAIELNRDEYVKPGPVERAQYYATMIDAGVMDAARGPHPRALRHVRPNRNTARGGAAMSELELPDGLEWGERAGGEIGGVSYPKRIVTLVAVPYDTDAEIVEEDGREYIEQFARGSFDGIQPRTSHIHANRDHDRTKPVGRADKFYPSRREGLVADVKISRTVLGDETLALAEDRVLHSSIKFGAYPDDIEYSDRGLRRRIKRAFLDHIAFVTEPAYATASVLSVRHRHPSNIGRSETPLLDEILAGWADDDLRSQFKYIDD